MFNAYGRRPFTLEDFHATVEKYDYDSEIGDKVKGTVVMIDPNGADIEIPAKSSAYILLKKLPFTKLKMYPRLYDIAWERCRQLQAEDVVVRGKVSGENKGGMVAVVEGLFGFLPFSQISMAA
ncbi:hypothetical protein HPP92_001692 [Vanilla planifolia]|uniref:Ribosomal protein S1 n=1 Tax=Vanilla planifolia TaxID=51239 RepID=A0A835RZT1_VANPL|nr:hypothetical protein HPP92_001692 [Vanilla planifolia]